METVLISGVWIAWNEGVDVFLAMFIVKSDASFVPQLSLIIFVVKIRYPSWDCFSINGICCATIGRSLVTFIWWSIFPEFDLYCNMCSLSFIYNIARYYDILT